MIFDIIMDVAVVWFGICALFWLIMCLSCLVGYVRRPSRQQEWYREHAHAEFRNQDGSDIRL
jgi:hypothetical protein